MQHVVTKKNIVVGTFDPFQLYVLIRSIAEKVLSLSKENGTAMSDNTKQSPNPYYKQTTQGVFLEMYYGSPKSLWTPWGEWNFAGSGYGWDNTGDLLPFFGATVHQEEVQNKMGCFGPVYALHKVGDLDLPEPIAAERSQFKSYETCCAEWKDLTARYHALRGEQIPMDPSEKWALSRLVCEERGKREPKIGPTDIMTYDAFRSVACRGMVVKYTYDGGATWSYSIITGSEETPYSNGELGFSADEEVRPYVGTHASIAFVPSRFEKRGMVVRIVTDPSEIVGITFSYTSKHYKVEPVFPAPLSIAALKTEAQSTPRHSRSWRPTLVAPKDPADPCRSNAEEE